MAKIRVGFKSDFNIEGNNVGFGTTNPTASLHVVDNLQANFNISGVAKLTSYGGFVSQKQNIKKPASIGFATVGVGTISQYYEIEKEFTDLGGVHHGDDQKFNTLSEDLVIDDGQILNITNINMVGVTTIVEEFDPHDHSSYVCGSSLDQLSVTGHFSVPTGNINQREETPIEGSVRFNYDLATLEFFNGDEWRQFTCTSASGRGLFAGGYAPAPGYAKLTSISSISIPSTGNAVDFGDLVSPARTDHGGFSSSVRGVFHQGIGTPDYGESLDYTAIASGGTAADFGNLNQARTRSCGSSNSTRGFIAGGFYPSGSTYREEIDYMEIATTGSAADFGNLDANKLRPSAVSSPTRVVFVGGLSPGIYHTNMVSITIATKGDAVDFAGNHLFSGAYHAGGISNGVRGIIAGGDQSVNNQTIIGHINIASEGNAVNFGDLSRRTHHCTGTSNNTRGVIRAGDAPSGGSVAYDNYFEYVTISSSGNAVDFGDDVGNSSRRAPCSDSHGGLGGF